MKCWVENNLIVFSAELHRAFNILIVTVNFSMVVAAVANFIVGIIAWLLHSLILPKNMFSFVHFSHNIHSDGLLNGLKLLCVLVHLGCDNTKIW